MRAFYGEEGRLHNVQDTSMRQMLEALDLALRILQVAFDELAAHADTEDKP